MIYETNHNNVKKRNINIKYKRKRDTNYGN